MRHKMNFKELRKNIKGACASCVNVRSFINGKTIRDERILLTYNGEKMAVCLNNPNIIMTMRETPDTKYPLNECWTTIVA